MTLHEIKQAVNDGKTVHWSSGYYTVKKDDQNQWLIVGSNGSAIGLTWADNTTLNGKPEDFFLAPMQNGKNTVI